MPEVRWDNVRLRVGEDFDLGLLAPKVVSGHDLHNVSIARQRDQVRNPLTDHHDAKGGVQPHSES